MAQCLGAHLAPWLEHEHRAHVLCRDAAAAGRLRKTKIVCTIGPTSCSRENLFKLADSVRPQLLSLSQL